MMWEYCRFCNLTGYCENQNMGRQCNSGVKKLYEENQQLRKFLEEFNALEVAEENKKLKELLKEIRSLWKGTICMPDSQEQVRDILIKIDNVIGEKK